MFVAFVAIAAGRFLLGYYVGRRRLLHDVPKSRGLLRRLLWGGLAAGLVAGGSLAVFRFLMMKKVLPRDSPWNLLTLIADEIGTLGMAAAYVAAISLLFQRRLWQRLLSLLAPAGQMALTNYLGQTAISIFIFYGVGLGYIGTFSPKLCITVAAGIFTVQIALSHLWLSRFRFGPIEWLWRSLTYGKAQPIRRRAFSLPSTTTEEQP